MLPKAPVATAKPEAGVCVAEPSMARYQLTVVAVALYTTTVKLRSAVAFSSQFIGKVSVYHAGVGYTVPTVIVVERR